MGDPPPHSRVLIPASSLPCAPAVPCGPPSPHRGRSPTMTRSTHAIRGFGDGLASPDHFRRRFTRLVSYYALFKGMAASKPTSQLSRQIHILCFSTQPVLRDLSRRSGFLPSRARTLSHVPCLPGLISRAFGVCLGSVGCEPPSPMQCSTSRRRNARGRTSIRFGENQLSPSLISLSLLSSVHPLHFQL